MIGETILHYHIIEKLGEGGMGVVYLAEDIKLGRKVAIKFVPGLIAGDCDENERLKNEARAAGSLNHPNISTIYAIEEAEDTTFIVMEYIDGVELSEMISSGSLSIDEVVGISLQIAEGLEAAHRKGIVHRDIKSQNIMITREGKVKIMDFGVARIGKDPQVTGKGATAGTLAYMAPEIIRGAVADKRSDIFSFGVIIYEMLTGHLPFLEEYEAAIAHLILNEPPQPVEKYGSDIPEALISLINRSLEKIPADRYQSVSEMLTDLRELSEHKYLENKPQPEESIRPFKNRKLVIALGTLFVLSLMLIGYFLFHNKNEEVSTSSPGVNSLAVMYFDNVNDPEDQHHIGEMITNLLITSLSQTKGLEVISREQLYRILEDLNISDNKLLTKKTAISVAQNAGLSTILVGSLLEDEPSFAATIQLIDVNSGHILGSHRVVGFDSKKIFPFVDSLALLVINDLEIAVPDSFETKPVAAVTTDSPEAYRAYVEGLNLSDKLYLRESVAAFRKAIELDSGFAMAYYQLAQNLNEPVESRRLINKAVELADNVTEREKLLIYAMNFSRQAKRKQASEIYRKIIEKYPHETEAYNQLASISTIDINLLSRGVKFNPSSKLLWDQLALSYAVNDRKQEALDAINDYIRLAPAEPNPYDSKAEIFGLFMEYDSSEIYFKKALEFRKDFWNVAIKLGNLEVLKGRFDEAKKYFDMSGDAALKYPSVNVYHGLLNSEIKRLEKALVTISDIWEETCTRTILIHLYYETRQYTKMLQMAKESTDKWKKIFPHDHYGRSLLVWALAKNKKSSEAETIIDNMLKEGNESFPWVKVHALFAASVLSYEEGNYQFALDKFNETFSNLKPIHEPNIFQAVCLLKTGHIKEAEVEFIRIKNWPMTDLCYQMHFIPGGRFYGYINNVRSHYWLGVIHEKLNEKDKAAEEYRTFLNIWKNADFNSPELSDAKTRLASLEN